MHQVTGRLDQGQADLLRGFFHVVVLLQACEPLDLFRHLVAFSVKHVSFLSQNVFRLRSVINSKKRFFSNFLLRLPDFEVRVGNALARRVLQQDLDVLHARAAVVLLLLNGGEAL